ncbi:MAG TPA: hypothetical protein DEP53_00210 [Bacteroidetes bacterium]|nr:hypothetical protein [Bacteroidota bacterium]
MLLFLGVVLLALRGAAVAQCDGKPGPDGLSWEFDEGEKQKFSLLRFLGNVVTPDLVNDTRRIRTYVRDERFGILLKRCGEMRAIDAIYLKALKIAEHSVGRALFLALVATLEHRDVNLKVPIIGSVGLPLTFEEDSTFHARMRNLPSKIYVDTPPEGDRDKLQHFFGSAYIAYTAESREFARTSGDLVEWGEAKFVVGGVDDDRDRRANSQGERFGHDLLTIKNLLPSDYLNLPYRN